MFLIIIERLPIKVRPSIVPIRVLVTETKSKRILPIRVSANPIKTSESIAFTIRDGKLFTKNSEWNSLIRSCVIFLCPNKKVELIFGL